MPTLEYIVRRLVLSVGVLLGMTVITFTLTQVIPSNPAALYLGPRARPAEIDRINEKFGFNKPLPQQYARYLGNLLRFDLGDSIATKRPVVKELSDRLAATIELLATAMLIAVTVGVSLGILSARLQGRAMDTGVRGLSIVGVSLPSFWLGLLLQLLFAHGLGLLPVAGRIDAGLRFVSPIRELTGLYTLDALLTGNLTGFWDAASHLVLPALTLAAYPIGLIARMTRATMLEVLNQDYIRTGRAYGIGEWRLHYRHALKNTVGPILTIIGLTLAFSLTGAFYVEIIFNWPGLGLFTARSFLNLDYPAIMGMTLFTASGYVLVNLVVDLLQAWIDPRIRLG
jgi:peptide/nickel transport system permease protein